MDTNRNNGQNYQINAFNKGMNTDTALDAVAEGQYIFGLNIRIANNNLLLWARNPNNKEGLVTPVEEGFVKTISIGERKSFDRILATASIGDTGVVIVALTPNQGQTKSKWVVYRADNNVNSINFSLLYESESTTARTKFSVVMNKEQEDIIKLYIADGEHGIMQLFVKNENLSPSELNKAVSEDELTSGKYFPSNKAVITGTASGKLRTQQVQYTYRFYKRYGIFSKLAPLTNKILVINKTRDTELGNAENTTTTIGISLNVALDETIKNLFDHILLIRVSYVVAGQVPEIGIIKDIKIPNGDNVNIIDVGEDPLVELSLDEFTSLNTQTLIPDVIEANQGYLFAANVKDDTVFTVNQNNVSFGIELVIGTLAVESTKSIKNDENIIYTTPTLLLYGTHHGPIVDDIETLREWFQKAILEIDLLHNGGNSNPTEPVQNIDDVAQGITLAIVNAITQIQDPVILDPMQIRLETIATIRDYLSDSGILKPESEYYSGYEDMFVSSMCRSLRRGETYLYGIVLYKKDGTHSDVLKLTLITIPSERQFPSWEYNNNTLYALPIGLYITVNIENLPDKNDIIGYEVVRCEKTPHTSRVLLTSVLSRPISEQIDQNNNEYTPAYPLFFLNSSSTELNPTLIDPKLRETGNGYQFNENSSTLYYGLPSVDDWQVFVSTDEYYFTGNGILRRAFTEHTNNLIQIFAPEILFKRQDVLNNISNNTSNITPTYYLGLLSANYPSYLISETNNPIALPIPHILPHEYKDKSTNHVMFDYINRVLIETDTPTLTIKRVKDVKNPLWDSGFTQIDTKSSDSRIINGIKSYKTYNTSIGQYEYVNWIANGMYDLPIGAEEAKSDIRFNKPGIEQDDDKKAGFRVYNDATHYDFKTRFNDGEDDTHSSHSKDVSVMSPIGPGPVCLLAELNESVDGISHFITRENVGAPTTYCPTTTVVNILNASFSEYTEDQKLYTPYFGFGDFFKFEANSFLKSNIVFDGDAYTTMCEFTTMFKTYDFQSLNDTLISNQYVCRVPMESTINTYFDYGMNYRNTLNKNLQLEPGTITNVTTQDRPLHQYNPIYSDNNTSVSVYTAQPEESRTNQFQQRIFYSQHKDNGEQMESWNIFKPVDYIDADTRYGEVTNLLSANDTIFFWQNRAFGKLSVNERSLITDNNSNTIQLGQGGVLQRTDYLSTKYGMRPEDYSAINTENGLFWIDILNKAIVANTQQGVINYSEQLNVQNLINEKMSNDIPEIDYDLQNSELLCKCLENNEQLIFNIKYNISTSVYTRGYDKLLYFNNVMYALTNDLGETNGLGENTYYHATQLNYLNNYSVLLSPSILKFVVNDSPSQTKVFDNQKIVVARQEWEPSYGQVLNFETDLNKSEGFELDNKKNLTDREGNICYAIPRDTVQDPEVGLRMRGKWMTVEINDPEPKQDFAISHIITKFRQSYS